MELVPPSKPPANIRKAIVAKRRLEVSRLTLRGLSVTQIAAELHEKAPTIAKDRRTLLKEWKAGAQVNIEEHRARILQELGEVKRQAWEGWDTSKAERRKSRQVASPTTNAQGQPGPVKPTRIEQTKEERGGDAKFLQVLQRTLAQESKLLGLTAQDPPEAPDPAAPSVNVLVVGEAGLAASIPWLSNIPAGRAEHGQPLLGPGEDQKKGDEE